MSRFDCARPDCDRGVRTGHVIYRISPKGKGEPFVGLCEEHMAEDAIDPEVKAVADVFARKPRP